MEKTCPRCGEKFECRHNDVAHCGCSKVKLGREAATYMARTYGDSCLCVRCLQEMEAEAAAAGKAGGER